MKNHQQISDLLGMDDGSSYMGSGAGHADNSQVQAGEEADSQLQRLRNSSTVGYPRVPGVRLI
jgi:hypothetical protein